MNQLGDNRKPKIIFIKFQSNHEIGVHCMLKIKMLLMVSVTPRVRA